MSLVNPRRLHSISRCKKWSTLFEGKEGKNKKNLGAPPGPTKTLDLNSGERYYCEFVVHSIDIWGVVRLCLHLLLPHPAGLATPPRPSACCNRVFFNTYIGQPLPPSPASCSFFYFLLSLRNDLHRLFLLLCARCVCLKASLNSSSAEHELRFRCLALCYYMDVCTSLAMPHPLGRADQNAPLLKNVLPLLSAARAACSSSSRGGLSLFLVLKYICSRCSHEDYGTPPATIPPPLAYS